MSPDAPPVRRRRRRPVGGAGGAADATAGAGAGGEAPLWRGLEGGRFRPLRDGEVEAVHEAVLELLENLGLSAASEAMIERVTHRGGRLDDDGRLLFPRALVGETLADARRSVRLHGQGDDHDIDLGGARAHTSSGGAAPSLLDADSGQYRAATAKDLFDAARLVDALDNIHHFSRSLVVADAPDNFALDINTAYACLAGTAKPVAMSVSEPAHVGAIADLCYRVAGGEDAFRAAPFMTILVCHVVPPMRFAADACVALEAAIAAGFPVQLISAGQAGATSPASIAGSLAQAIAETLAGLVCARLVDADAKVIFAPKPLVADLRTGAMSGGGGEQAILMAAAAQMGRFYDLPTSSIAGITDSKLPDAQHGYEKNLAVSLALHAGSNLVTQACGMQASLLGASLESYVVDNDMLGAILRSVRGVEVNAETLAADVIAEVCRGEGHYLGHPQTYARMKRDYVYPQVGDRRTPAQWQEEGSHDMLTRARAEVRRILDQPRPRHLADDVDAYIRAKYPVILSRAQMDRGG
ncbi:MAG: trimethylamine methyltransferase family protein [bacterium]